MSEGKIPLPVQSRDSTHFQSIAMKFLLCLFTLVALCLSRMEASNLKLDGDLTWQITEPLCTINLDGGIQNLSPAGSISGTIKLVLWATPRPFPSAGSVVAEYTLGRIKSGYQFSDFTIRTNSKIPKLTGPYHFTIAVVEYTSSGWRTRAIAATGTRELKGGDFTAQTKWQKPITAIVAPPAKLLLQNRLTLTPIATSDLNILPEVARQPFTLDVSAAKRVTVTRPDETSPAAFTYSVKKLTYNKKKIATGSLALDYKAAGKTSKIYQGKLVLYFQTTSSGFYQNSETDYFGNMVSWGTFTFN
jgi:hypothetical protein